MLPSQDISIAVVDAAYDLRVGLKPWLRGLLKSGEALFDQGLGCVAVAVAGLTGNGEPLVSRVVARGETSNDLALRFARGSRSVHVDQALTALDSNTSAVQTLSSVRSEAPHLHLAIRRRVGCKDALALLALDSELHGVVLLVPTRAQISLSSTAERRWRTLASHIGAADRLRRALGRSNQERLIPITALPRELRADTPTGPPPPRSGLSLRGTALRADAAKQGASEGQGVEALDVLHGLLEGKVSMVDSFDRNGRRFILARRHDASLGDPRGLTPTEQQVALRTARGESRKLAGYHLGISRSRVSRLLGSAMRKLGVRNQTELVMKVRCLESHGLVDDN